MKCGIIVEKPVEKGEDLRFETDGEDQMNVNFFFSFGEEFNGGLTVRWDAEEKRLGLDFWECTLEIGPHGIAIVPVDSDLEEPR